MDFKRIAKEIAENKADYRFVGGITHVESEETTDEGMAFVKGGKKGMNEKMTIVTVQISVFACDKM